MTYEEAKMQIQAIPEKIWDQLSEPDREAMEMAFSALQAQDVPDTNVGDMISRQAAKLKVARVIWEDGDSCYDFHDKCVDCLDDVPSAQPEPQWVPVSERLPEDGTDCLVSIRCQAKVVLVDMATYSTDLFKVDEEDFFGNRGESGWYCFDGEYGYCKVLNVIAWMPLPEPYRAERRTDGRD